MALSFKTVQRAYEIMQQLRKEFDLELKIPSYPNDMGEWDEDKQKNPPTMELLGWGKKYDDGWESLSFFIVNPHESLLKRFQEIGKLPNTMICEPYFRNKRMYCIGWF